MIISKSPVQEWGGHDELYKISLFYYISNNTTGVDGDERTCHFVL